MKKIGLGCLIYFAHFPITCKFFSILVGGDNWIFCLDSFMELVWLNCFVIAFSLACVSGVYYLIKGINRFQDYVEAHNVD